MSPEALPMIVLDEGSALVIPTLQAKYSAINKGNFKIHSPIHSVNNNKGKWLSVSFNGNSIQSILANFFTNSAD
jgi:hypothetical protein